MSTINLETNAAIQLILQEYVQEAGLTYCVDKCIEELAELIQSLIKVKNGQSHATDLHQEFADVMVTMLTIQPDLIYNDQLSLGQDHRISKILSHLDEIKGGHIAKSS